MTDQERWAEQDRRLKEILENETPEQRERREFLREEEWRRWCRSLKNEEAWELLGGWVMR